MLEEKPLPIVAEKPQEATYRIDNQQSVQGQVIGEHATVHQHYYPPVSPPLVSPISPEQVWMVPYARNPFFTGREELLTQLSVQFQCQ